LSSKKRRKRKVIVANVSDVHAGSTVALCPPKIALDDGGFYFPSKPQQWLWQGWNDYWNEVGVRRDAEDAELYVMLNGDLTEGSHHGTTQILSGNPSAQAAVVDACLAVPLALKPDRIWVIRGTEAHVGASACYEERIATGLWKDGRPVVRCEETDTASHWHARIDIQGVRFDVAHHGSIGSRAWTRNNVVNNLAADLFYNHAAAGVPHPHLALRGHMHQFADTGSAAPVRVLQSGAWQLKTAFTHRIDTRGKLAEVGGYIITVEDGDFDVRKVHFTPEVTPLWRA
jgi:hypothetical protein